MPWGEAIRLAQLLRRDPASQVCAALEDLDFPVSREWLVLAQLHDLTQYVHVDPKKRAQVKPYPRPYRAPGSKRRGRTNKSRAEVIAILNAHGHQIGA